ncbi:MAG: N-formylglutamate deformylase [SAR324 cluster bacterium]|nr:N-formylglutamate deformylase [SAR324 cluster bacterium]
MNPVEISEGNGPIILSQPHGGTFLPPELSKRLNERGLALADTDWHINRLYDGLLLGATVVQATFSRYLIDANRDPSGTSLYPGQNTTDLCPTVDFDGLPIYKDETEPSAEEIEKRRKNYHAVYHSALSEQIERVHKKHGVVLLFDCHSIRSKIPFLFEGQLPDFNLGTNNGSTCDPKIEQSAIEVYSEAEGYSSVLNGRFKGGWTTRHYTDTANGIHTIQLELAQRTYMDEFSPWIYREERSLKIRIHLKKLLSCLEQLISSFT